MKRRGDEVMKRISRNNRSGFTMVELLVTILIVAGLLAMLAAGLAGARRLFSGVTAKNQLDIIAQTLEQYKQKFGEYPPDAFASDNEVKRHILKRWPKILKNAKTNDGPNIDVCLAYFNLSVRGIPEGGSFPTTPEKVLLFWLCGPERYFWTLDANGVATNNLSSEPDQRMGFSANDANPFDIVMVPSHSCYGKAYPTNDVNSFKSYESPLCDLKYDTDFSDRKNKGNCNMYALVYKDIPIVYFRSAKIQNGSGNFDFGYWGASPAQRLKYFDFRRAASFDSSWKGGINPAIGFYDIDVEINSSAGMGIAVPYAKNHTWFSEENFQLILPGEDERFGDYNELPRDLNECGSYTFADSTTKNIKVVTSPDLDNITNFITGTTLQMEIDK